MIEPDEKLYVVHITTNRDSCFLILSPLRDGVSVAVEILAYNPKTREIQKVESVFPAPKVLRVGIGPMWTVQGSEPERVTNLFYYELTGDSALAAHKSIVSKFPFDGLANGCVEAKITSLKIEPTGKLRWDPTVGRKWKLAYAEYSLKRGNVDETDDIYSSQLDGDFAYYMGASHPCKAIQQDRGNVQSWSSIIPTVFNTTSKKWEFVQYDPRFSKPPEVSKTTHEILFNSRTNGNSCMQLLKKLMVTKQLSPMEGAPGFPPLGAHASFKDPISESIEKIKNLECVSSVNRVI